MSDPGRLQRPRLLICDTDVVLQLVIADAIPGTGIRLQNNGFPFRRWNVATPARGAASWRQAHR